MPTDADKLRRTAGSIGQQPLDGRPSNVPRYRSKAPGMHSRWMWPRIDPGVLAESLLEQPLDVVDRDPLAVGGPAPSATSTTFCRTAPVTSGPQDSAHAAAPVVLPGGRSGMRNQFAPVASDAINAR